MWQIVSITSTPRRQCYYADGAALPSKRDGESVNFMIEGIGYIAFEVTEESTYTRLELQQTVTFAYQGDAKISLVVVQSGQAATAKVTVEADFPTGEKQQTATVNVTPAVFFWDQDDTNFDTMISDGTLPYRSLPAPSIPKTHDEIEALADKYFKGLPFGYEMAYTISDWTSADFFRMLMFSEMAYTGVNTHPLDFDSICQLIWDHYYPPSYSAQNADFMNMFGLQPANDVAGIKSQWTPDEMNQMRHKVSSLIRFMAQGVLCLPKIAVEDLPILYRGAMPLNSRPDSASSVDRFGPSLWEFPGNTGPITTPLRADINAVFKELLQPGSIITPKACWSFTDSYSEALDYQNGIVITAHPPQGAKYWPSMADIVEFSVNPSAKEYNCVPRTRYLINSAGFQMIEGRNLLMLDVTILGLNSQL